MTEITRDEALRRLAAVLMDVDVAVALAQAMGSFANVCEKHGYRISPATLRIYSESIVEVLCATKEQENAEL